MPAFPPEPEQPFFSSFLGQIAGIKCPEPELLALDGKGKEKGEREREKGEGEGARRPLGFQRSAL